MDDPARTEHPRPEPRVERARPADRGLVARLVEAVVAADPSVAPEVASGALRAAQWLQRTPADWQGVAVVEDGGVRSVVGYVAADSGPGSAAGVRAHRVLVHPAYRDSGLGPALVAAARAALADEPAPAPTVVEPDPAPELVRVETPPVTWRQRLTEPAGALAIVAAGAVAVLAVQVGGGPLGDVVPFLDRDADRPASAERGGVDEADVDGRSADPSSPPASSVPVPGVVLTPVAAPSPPAPSGDPQPGPGPGQPTTPPAPPATPAPTPPGTPGPGPGPTSGLLDPVVEEVVEVLDGATGSAVAPVTGAVRDLLDATTDVLDGVLGVLIPPRAGSTG
ncbi:GNAT family N-acetyltransferase [Nocardioides abyssi]|uniref:N-acetyltransferase domain-containing protein n=1 Tax=Nocardioides abyssi TaxID=3058370 RepID=A0ABT8EUM5_9ACTN|nr:GNAT family N-acetyltransferase [Nocardioides abyssi]MDN4161784.1 hypothetical protein [Nocardioides abyssi]